MKNICQFLGTIAFIFWTLTGMAQTTRPSSIAVLHIDTQGFTLSPQQMGDLLRIELAKLSTFDILDRYDMEYLLEKKELDIENCYGKLCLVEMGKQLGMDKMLGGSVQLFGNRIAVTLRLIDVGKATVEKEEVVEFLDLRNQVQTMLGITLQKMFELPVDENLWNKLTEEFDYENAINTPEANQLNLSGPRMGVVFMTGELAEIFKAPLEEGGFEIYPVMSQFGYQFEIKYLNQGDFQALFEFIPMVSGLDQGKFLPSLVFLNGMRSNKTGFEFAFGPSVFFSKQASGFWGNDGQWYLDDELPIDDPNYPENVRFRNRLDSRGEISINTSFVIAIGKSFRSGALNIPVNVFFIPGKNDGHRFGISTGFNISR